MTRTTRSFVAAAATAATVFAVAAAGSDDCALADCSTAFVLLAVPYVVFPIAAGALVAGDDRSPGSRWVAAAATGGMAAVATALSTLLFVDSTDPDRGAFIIGWLLVAPIAAALAIPLVAVGQALVAAEPRQRTGGLLRLVAVGGGFLLLVASLMPWTSADAGLITLTTSGLSGNRWGVATLLCGLLIIGATASELRKAYVVVALAGAGAAAVATLVILAPSIHAPAPEAVDASMTWSSGPVASLVGGAMALLGTVGARRSPREDAARE